MPITVKNSAGGGVTLDSSTSSNETINLNTPVFTGNVGVGVVPEAWHSDYVAVQVGDGGALASKSTGDATFVTTNAYRDSVNNRWEYIGANGSQTAASYQQSSGKHFFQVAPSGTADAAISWTTAMTINNTDDVVVGNFTTNGSQGGVRLHYNNYADGSGAIFTSVTNTATRGHFWFYNPNGQVGTITTNGSSTAYNTSSDYRLKENVTPMSGATAQTKLLKPCNFDWIAGGNVNGFIAHELAEVVPEAVSGTKDAMMDEEYEVTAATDTEAAVMGTRSIPDMQGIDQSKLVPLLTATIQDLITRIEALENV